MRHRLALVGVVAVLVAAAFLGAAQASGLPDTSDAAGTGNEIDTGTGALVSESSPVAAVAVGVRVRGWSDAELSSVVRFALSPLLAFASVALLRLVPQARAWWRLWRRDRWSASPLRGSTLAALRAPPALV
jgi:hypothetical protein